MPQHGDLRFHRQVAMKGIVSPAFGCRKNGVLAVQCGSATERKRPGGIGAAGEEEPT